MQKEQLAQAIDMANLKHPYTNIEVRFHSEAKVKIGEKSLLLQGKEAQMLLLSLSENNLRIKEGKHPYQPVHATREFEWIPYYGVHNQAKETVIATLILPVEDTNEIATIKKTTSQRIEGNQLNIHLTYKNKTYNYSFVKKDLGWVL